VADDEHGVLEDLGKGAKIELDLAVPEQHLIAHQWDREQMETLIDQHNKTVIEILNLEIKFDLTVAIACVWLAGLTALLWWRW